MQRLRVVLSLLALSLVTLVLLPVQWAAVRLDRPLAGRIPMWWHRIALALLRVRVLERGRPAETRPLLILSNHVSWLDISVIGSRMPLSFIAKAEVAGWPVFGLFAKLQRTVFVDRARRADTGRVTSAIAVRLGRGDPMVLFPEGTSTNGSEVLPFRSALVGAARQTLADGQAVAGDQGGNGAGGAGQRAMVQPLSIAYTRLAGLPMGRIKRPLVAWYGDMDLAPHLLALMAGPPVDVELSWGEPIPFGPGTDRKSVTAKAEDEVRTMTMAALTGRAATPAA
ncbi:1-acyl-sn-glycerol-3-phosphate acyltransferase [Pseudoxanthobacter soli DSM 19599]|uniref:1-acyl-sn-glycerol-3-phosphate acyltransferase n=1 Tax=Pseudoxanthobacter soli DSM 19599 TaxID=1123029 RepID=A0A1M7ZJH6_9HYPH|nr:lysophospholipid acyltransferase family protein [Pseudoxanthobacter soli]SHO65051.1 1-acyl-sn-glycerol-3-phosphate acyltransferase [Pseudoxanthobacter soli DSM 19599]